MREKPKSMLTVLLKTKPRTYFFYNNWAVRGENGGKDNVI